MAGYSVGDRVEVLWHGELFNAKVIQVPFPDVFDVVYEIDGSVGKDLTEKEHRLRLLPPLSTPKARMPHKSVYGRFPKPWTPDQVVTLLLPLRQTLFMAPTVKLLQDSNCVAVSASSVAKVVKRVADGGVAPSAWDMRGKPLLVTDEELASVVRQYSLSKGETISETS